MRQIRVFQIALAVLAAPLSAQTATDVLAKVADTYSHLTSCHFEGTRVTETKIASSASSQQLGFVVAFAKPDKVRVEFSYGRGDVWVRTGDGTTFTRYRSATKELSRKPETPGDFDVTDSTFLQRYERINQGVADAKIVSSETLHVGGSDVDCDVVEVRYSGGSPFPGSERLPSRFWIDKARYVVWREVSGSKAGTGHYITENTTTTNFTEADVNHQVPLSLFAFEKNAK